ncbi:MAG: glucose-6-phosphate isomerase [Treponema sp.]|nr:glucose-6-phosphate isomerase [Treponema sp.]
MVQFRNLDEAPAFRELRGLKPADLRSTLTAEAVEARKADAGGGLTFSWAASDAGDETIGLLCRLAKEQELVEKYRLLASGQRMNTGEDRMVLHHLTRGEPAGPVIRDGRNYRAFYEGERARIADFARKIHSGSLTGSTGKPFRTAVQIGIVGSDLGPRALFLALETWARTAGRTRMSARFLSNVDPDDADGIFFGLDPETTLFILVSKSGTTQETLANETLARDFLRRRGPSGLDPSRHIVAVTSETSPLARNPGYLDSFYIDDFIGGRYSSTSAVGGVILSLAFGPETFAELLEGAREADERALSPEPLRNPPLLDALLGIFERNVLGRPCVAILPYSQALSRFPAHLQQLDMESNGKQVNRDGKPVAYPTGPVVFGEPGTNGQHSFYQLLHQGTDIVPLEFIGFLENQGTLDMTVEGSTSRAKLNANLAAQIVAFAKGQDNANPNKRFPGGRPSTLLYGRSLDPRALGALLAHFENKVMFQGFAWNLNSFDQEGVQLGKVLTKQVLAGGPLDGALDALSRALGIR